MKNKTQIIGLVLLLVFVGVYQGYEAYTEANYTLYFYYPILQYTYYIPIYSFIFWLLAGQFDLSKPKRFERLEFYKKLIK